MLGQVIQRETRRQWEVGSSQLHSRHLLCPVTLSTTSVKTPCGLVGALGLFQPSADSPFCKTTCFTQFLLRTKPVVRLWQVNGPSEMQSFFSYSNQWQPSSVQNPRRWRCEPRERNGNAIPSHTPFNLRNIDSWDGRWKGMTKDAKRTVWGFV